MDSEFPDPDDEFDLVHEDEYEVLREIQAEINRKNQLSKSEQAQTVQSKESEKEKTDDAVPSCSTQNSMCTLDNNKKRNYDELFGDIDDILASEDLIKEPKEKKFRWDQPDEIIKAVLEAKRKVQEENNTFLRKKFRQEEKDNSVSLKIPFCNFITLTRLSDSQRVYVKAKSANEKLIRKNQATSNLLSVPLSQLKAQAEEIIIKNVERASVTSSQSENSKGTIEDDLWVDKYKPRSYLELLTDESVNRHFLYWLKLWDKVVFNRSIPSQKKKKNPLFRNKKVTDDQTPEELDNRGFPIYKIALLTGPPGLGKTTLAHLVARHAGYNVVEINASDESGPDAFRQILLSTQMKAVIGGDPKPNCLILDEIDGAPAKSIDVLIDFVQGKLAAKGKKNKARTERNICQRPIICICNELYTPSLRALRNVALVIQVPEISVTRLTERLTEIASKENLKVDLSDLITLATRSGCDIRTCLGALQYSGGAKLENNSTLGLKDVKKGLFDTWKEIFRIPNTFARPFTTSERARNILKIIQSGETERLAQGVFHNYLAIDNEKLKNISVSLDWFQFFDEIVSYVGNHQTWSVMPYTNYAFVVWHLHLAKMQNPKLSFPFILQEVYQKRSKSVSTLVSMQQASGYNSTTIVTDIAPFLPDILTPRLRTVSGYLRSSKEQADFTRIVNIMLDFGLTFVQEKTAEGGYEYKLCPDVFEIGTFPECKMRRKLLDGLKQLIAQELETERVKRQSVRAKVSQNGTQNKPDNAEKDTVKKNDSTDKTVNQLPNNSGASNSEDRLEKLKDKIRSNEVVYKDFFGRVITADQSKGQSNKKTSPRSEKMSIHIREIILKHGVWYKYKEGFSNAVRRTVLIEDLL